MNSLSWKASVAICGAVCLAALAVLLMRNSSPPATVSSRTVSPSAPTTEVEKIETPSEVASTAPEEVAPSSQMRQETPVVKILKTNTDSRPNPFGMQTQTVQLTKKFFDAPAELLNPEMPDGGPSNSVAPAPQGAAFMPVPMDENGMPIGDVPFPGSNEAPAGQMIPAGDGFVYSSSVGPALPESETAPTSPKK